jgi:hypothetical protein
MHFKTRAFFRVFFALVILDVAAFSVVFVRRPALTNRQWSFLDAQRPKDVVTGQAMDLNACADCLDFAVFRRGIGGWESFSAKLLMLANLPAFAAARTVFAWGQQQSSRTSKDNSDLATIVLVATVGLQCAVAAIPFTLQRPN